MSHLRIMPEAEILYRFKTTLLETPLKLQGKVVWGDETEGRIFEYGIEFSIDENERDILASLLMIILLINNQSPILDITI